MSTEQLVAAAPLVPAEGRWRPPSGLPRLRDPERRWALAFAAPYAAVFLAFVVYPFGYAVWLASDPSLYGDLFGDAHYWTTIVNTLVFVGVGVNLKLFLALLLSGFFLQRRWWVRALLPVFILPWAIAAAQACVSFHWMLIGEQGLVNGLLALVGIEGPLWFNHRWLGLGTSIAAYIWKWLPFWTVIFLAARVTIPRDVYDAAIVDGATGIRLFTHVTFPLLANLYLVCTLISTLWALGDFTTVFLVSVGGPGGYGEVLATFGYRRAFDAGMPAVGVAAVMSALPLLIPIAIMLMRRVQTREVRL